MVPQYLILIVYIVQNAVVEFGIVVVVFSLVLLYKRTLFKVHNPFHETSRDP